jgi:hypothetical protein
MGWLEFSINSGVLLLKHGDMGYTDQNSYVSISKPFLCLSTVVNNYM